MLVLAEEKTSRLLGSTDRDGPALSENYMAWVYLIAAGILEIIWAYAMKQSHGFTRLVPTLVMIVTLIGSFGLLSASVKTLPLGTAYAIWTGIGAVGAFLVGIMFLGEAVSFTRIVAAVLIVSGLVLMTASTPT